MTNIIVLVGVLFGLVAGWVTGGSSLGGLVDSSPDTSLVEYYTLPQQDMDAILKRSKDVRGEPVWSLIQASLKLRYSIVDDTRTIMTFADKQSDAQFALFCDASAHTVDVGFHLGLNAPGEDRYFSDFGIMHITKGADNVYEADNSVPLLFATDLGDTNLAEVLDSLNKLDPEDLIAFVLRDTDDDGFGVNKAWSYSYKVKEVVNALSQVNYKNCSNVELLERPGAI